MKKLALLLFLLVFSQSAFGSLNKSASARASLDSRNRTQYEITVDINPQKLSYAGRQKVVFTNNQTRSAAYLLFFLYPNDSALTKSNKKHLTVSSVTVNEKPAKTEDNGSFLRVLLPVPLPPGRSTTVLMEFSGDVPAQTGKKDMFSETIDQLMSILNPGQSEPDYGIFSSNKDILNLGLWYPILSKFDTDGWDEEKYAGIGDVSYFDPADFRVSILAPFDAHVVTTGSVVKRAPGANQKMEYSIEAPMCRDFEIELSSRYQESTRVENRTTIRSYFLPEHTDSGRIAVETAARAFTYFERAFGAYPYTELEVVEAPLYGGAGGVEFPGLVTISSMLYKEEGDGQGEDFLKQLLADNPAFDQLLEFVVAHEVAHQWWNAVVGSNSKKYPFIDEAMANYSAVLYFEHYYGREAAEQQMAMQMKVNYQLHRMMGGPDMPVNQPASAFNGPLEYSAIVYGKGALYFDHLRDLMGDQAFFAALRKYYDNYWFGIAAPQDLKEVARKLSPEKATEIEALFQRWMEGKHGDEDIGAGTLEALMNTVLSTRSPDERRNAEELMKQLQEILKQ